MFDRYVVISLDRRKDRLQEFFFRCRKAGWTEKPEVLRFTGIDGLKFKMPSWWHETPGAWGCLISHLRLIEDCISQGVESCLVFEDDAVFADNFAERFDQFMEAVPDDWNMVYPGGCCRKVPMMPPTYVNEQVCRAKCLTGTWCYGFRGLDFMRQLYVDLLERLFTDHRHHVDIMLCHLHEFYRVYVPHRWLVLHPVGDSDVRKGGKTADTLEFPDPIELATTSAV